jgi:hypothetical protein
MSKEICKVNFITLWDDGKITVDDGVGFVGELSITETYKIYQNLHKFFESEKLVENPISKIRWWPL